MSPQRAKAFFCFVVVVALVILFWSPPQDALNRLKRLTGRAQTTALAEEHRTVSQRLVAQIDDSTLAMGSLTVSRDSRRVAYVAKVGAKAFVVVDGKAEKHYDGIGKGSPIFSPDSQRVAYMAREGEKWFVVVDGKEEKHYDDICQRISNVQGDVFYVGTPIFSLDSRRLAYVAKVGAKLTVVVDGKEQKPYDDIGGSTLIFSPDSQRVAYAVAVGAKQSVVVDGKEGKPYDWIGALLFSPDSRRVAYMAGVDGRRIVVVDGKEAKPYAGVAQGEGPQFWPDSRWVLDAFYVVIFSPDSRRVAYAASAGATRFVVVDGKAEKHALQARHEGWQDGSLTDNPIFSPDSQRLAYAAWARENAPTEPVRDKGFVVVDGKKEKSYHHIAEGSVLFSPDSRRLAYMAQQDGKWCVVVDGKEEKPYDGIYFTTEINFGQWNEGPIFSPDSRRVAYMVAVGAKQSVVVDGKEGKPYDGLTAGSLIFSPDSRRVAYGAKAGAKAFVVVDGKEGKSYDGLVKGTTIVFNSANALNYLAHKRTTKGLDVYLVEETID